jgi:hypothetical protein
VEIEQIAVASPPAMAPHNLNTESLSSVPCGPRQHRKLVLDDDDDLCPPLAAPNMTWHTPDASASISDLTVRSVIPIQPTEVMPLIKGIGVVAAEHDACATLTLTLLTLDVPGHIKLGKDAVDNYRTTRITAAMILDDAKGRFGNRGHAGRRRDGEMTGHATARRLANRLVVRMPSSSP